jgi:exonuclease VII small subunit
MSAKDWQAVIALEELTQLNLELAVAALDDAIAALEKVQRHLVEAQWQLKQVRLSLM